MTTIYELMRIDYEHYKKVNTELYFDEVEAKNEMWNKIHFQRRIREGLEIEMVNSNHIKLVRKLENEKGVQVFLEFKIDEKIVH